MAVAWDAEPTAGEELRLRLDRVADHPLPEPRTALLAIAARRAAAAGRWAEALDTALAIAGRLDDPLAAAKTRARLGIAWLLLRDHDAAVEHLVHALTRFKQAGTLDPPYTVALELLGLIRMVPDQAAAEVLSAAYVDAMRGSTTTPPCTPTLPTRSAGPAAPPGAADSPAGSHP